MGSKPNKPLLRSLDVAHVLDCCPDDVNELAQKGELKGTEPGRYWWFRPEDVLDQRSHKGDNHPTY